MQIAFKYKMLRKYIGRLGAPKLLTLIRRMVLSPARLIVNKYRL